MIKARVCVKQDCTWDLVDVQRQGCNTPSVCAGFQTCTGLPAGRPYWTPVMRGSQDTPELAFTTSSGTCGLTWAHLGPLRDKRMPFSRPRWAILIAEGGCRIVGGAAILLDCHGHRGPGWAHTFRPTQQLKRQLLAPLPILLIARVHLHSTLAKGRQ